jgi:omega-6 fatty acid desaturase (delta-12 desaturase)
MGYTEVLFNTKTRPEKAASVTGDLPFTLADIRQAIPAELFKADKMTSWYYIARDLTLFVAIGVATNYLLELAGDSLLFRLAIWATYTVVQGAVGFGLWVIGHECGHQAYFGDGHWLNDPVGYVIHSAYCDPYHSWRVTHATHHRYTNNKELDTAFPPKDYPAKWYDAGEAFPPLHLLMVVLYLTVGWPMYICFNFEGHRYKEVQNHFTPSAPMFQKRDRLGVVLSDIGVVIMMSILGFAVYQFGAWPVATYYGLFWVGTHAWLVLVTFLQHSDARVPHYDEDENFNFVKGAIATVDRDYGSLWNNLTHHITDAHVVHHVFSRVPFYQAKKMTPYVARVLGKHYVYDERPFFQQLWEAWWSHQSSFFESKKWTKANPNQSKLAGKNLNQSVTPPLE